MLLTIEVGRLIPHPNNPRQELGDLTELAESIKVQGILQNLTIIPVDMEMWQSFDENSKKNYIGDFTILIGHRRTEAAKLAGLAELPCSIVTDMDESTQLATMLMENIQRNDLTLVEQGKSLQLMLDLEGSYKNVAEKTGISESTVRRKVKIYSTFGPEALAKVQDRPISLDDYDKVAKIKNPKKQAEVFDTIGTREFDWALKSAIAQQEKQDFKARMIEVLNGFATHTPTETNINRDNYWCYYEPSQQNLDALQKLAAKIQSDDKQSGFEYLYCSSDSQNWISVWAAANGQDDDKDSEEEKEKQHRINERMERHNKLRAKFEQAQSMRISFVKKFRTTAKTLETVNRMVLNALLLDSSICETTMQKVFDIKHKFRLSWQEGDGETQAEALARIFGGYSNKSRYSGPDLYLIGAYLRLESEKKTLHALNMALNCHAKYRNNPNLDRIYGYLHELGYQMSDEEVRLMDGTHEYYSKGEEDD